MERALDADLESFVRVQHPRLLASLVLLTGDVQAAEDLAQEAMVRVVDRWPRVRTLDAPAGWLHHVALNLVRSRWRRTVTARRAASRLGEETTSVDVDVAEMVALREALAHLPRRQREALVLRHVVGLDPDEVGVAMGCTGQAVRNLTNRATTTLRGVLTQPEEGLA